MEYFSTPLFSEKVSRVALGTWAIGGSLWGGTEEKDSIATILEAIEKGITLFDTAPAYGQGVSENYVGKALKQSKKRNQLLISTKGGIEFRKDGSAARNLTEEFLTRDLHNSLKRLGTDHIDIYFIHWPDPLVPIETSAKVMGRFFKEGKIRAIGVSNYDEKQIDAFKSVAPCHFCQPPYNIFERNIERKLLPFCKKEKILLMTYSALCRGLLSGKMSKKRQFGKDDLRTTFDRKFKPPAFDEYLSAADQIAKLAKEKYGKSLLDFAIRWVLDQGSDVALWGARRPDQLAPIEGIFGWHLDQATRKKVDEILRATVKHPQDVEEYMGPPVRQLKKAS